jgi:hypothetical protein
MKHGEQAVPTGKCHANTLVKSLNSSGLCIDPIANKLFLR